MASKGRMGIQEAGWFRKPGDKPLFQWPAKAGWGFRGGVGMNGYCIHLVSMASKGRMGIQDNCQVAAVTVLSLVSMASKGRMGIQAGLDWLVLWNSQVSMASKGRMGIQARPGRELGLKAGWRGFNGQQRPDGDSGTLITRVRPGEKVVSMASKGRMGIQVTNPELERFQELFQWPAKAGWGFRNIKNVAWQPCDKFQWPAKAGWGFRRSVSVPVRQARSFNGQQRPDGDSGT